MRSFLYSIPLLLLSGTALADILFLNFNGNTSSIAAAKKAALKRGEKVVVYPNETIKTITPASLDLIFKDVTAKKFNITNISLSGHDGGGSFAGKDGDIGKEDIRKALTKYPAIKNSVKSLLLRGCYSATMGQVQSQSSSDWRMIFPKVEFIAGYNDPAESSERAESKEFVEDMLSLESEFLHDKTLNEVVSTFKEVGLYNQMDAAVWIRQCNSFGPSTSRDGVYLTSDMAAQNTSPVLISEERKRCEKTRQETEKHMAIFTKYFSGSQKGFERPPSEHQGTDLRAAYSFIRQNEHCIPILMPDLATAFNPDRMIRLIYYDYIVSNFQDMYPSAPITKAIEANFTGSVLQNLKYPDLTKASRKEINTYINRLEGAAAQLYNSAKSDKDPKAVAGLKMWKHAQAMNASVGMIMPFHVPFSWVSEPHAKIPLSGLH